MFAKEGLEGVVAARTGLSLIDGEKGRLSYRGYPIHDLAASSRDRKSTRLNSSHLGISYAVFCLKKKKTNKQQYIDIERKRNPIPKLKEHARDASRTAKQMHKERINMYTQHRQRHRSKPRNCTPL